MEQDQTRKAPSFAEAFTPKLLTVLARGYSLADLKADAIAGLTVAIVALPLAMAIGIASGTTPDRGLYTAIIAGFLISALGGSRFQIGGPTAAFIVVVFNVVQHHGMDGLAIATFMAGLMLIAIGFLRLGSYIKYIPYPVIVGFTAGIAVSIFISQIKELLGLDATMPGEFTEKMEVLWHALPSYKPSTIAIAALALALIIGVKRWLPRLPNMLVAVVVCSAVVALSGLQVDTIGSRFGAPPSSVPLPEWPHFTLAKMRDVLPDAITIALLAGIESLLSAVIADGMTGGRHRSNCELVAQGVANCASVLFGGISATGAIARTATNIRSGGRTPVAGMLHAVFLLLFMLVAGPALSLVPLAALGAILTVVAWNISEAHAIHHIMTRATMGDRVVLLTTFFTTVAIDLTLAIEIGIVLASLIFVHRMSAVVEVGTHDVLMRDDVADTKTSNALPAQSKDVLVYRIDGPFFFGAAAEVISVLQRTGQVPRLYVLDFSAVPFIDSTAAAALSDFIAGANKAHARIVLVGVRPAPRATLEQLGLGEPLLLFRPTIDEALALHTPVSS